MPVIEQFQESPGREGGLAPALAKSKQLFVQRPITAEIN